jgi:potassium efflux system protein
MAYVGSMVVIAVEISSMFRPGGRVLSEPLARRRDGAIYRLRYFWHPLLVAAPLALGGLAAAGYYYTALQLTLRLFATVCVCGGWFVTYALVARYLLVVKRRLAREQAQERRATLQASAAQPSTGGRSSSAKPEDAALPEIPQTDLSAVSSQTLRIMRSLILLGGAICLWAIWIDVLPALTFLQNPVRSADGADPESQVTFLHVILALGIAAVAFIAARDVPGLLEMTILPRLPLDHGGRYAVASVSRYIITLVGIVLAFKQIGVGWEKVQWMVAAMSLGLAFGLQEIFANFVCGLIILLERPVRVGDIVNVGDVQGKVMRIRIRATTILDWDRRELIVPNKEFVTGKLINWTLSDPVTRVTIPVGIAHGSDVGKARNLLLTVATESEFVMDDPPPTAIFRGFGDSSLNLELRVFLANRDSWPDLVDSLHTRIHDEFQDSGIEISFPQRDIHIRSVEPAVAVLGQTSKRAAAAEPRSEHAA